MLHGLISLLILIILPHSLLSQPLVIPLLIKDNGSGQVTLRFGYHPNATYCIDGWLDSNLIESELPPRVPCVCFYAGFTDSRSGSGACLGEGTLLNLHGFSQLIDTFQIKFQPGEGGFPVTLSWPFDLSSYLNSAQLVDLYGGIIINVDMLSNLSTVITNPALNQLLIITTRSITSLDERVEPRELGFELDQNYPNPFNPETDIMFELPVSAFASLRMYNLVGELVATLVDDFVPAGVHRKRFDATGLSSGVYVYRLSSTSGTLSRKLLLLK